MNFQLNMLIFSYKGTFISYCLSFVILNHSLLLSGEVLAPYLPYHELSISNTQENHHIENRKFTDFGNSYIPAITGHLNGERSGWLTLWGNKNEFGLPMYHISGFSPAYLPSWLIAQFTVNPWRFITTLSLLTCFFTGVFVILFCKEIRLSPLSGLLAGASLATSPLFMYWLAFPMFPAIWCWSAGALWGVTRIAKKLDVLGWSILAFSIYSLLMMAYPQPVVFHAYILGGYGFYLTYHKLKVGWHEVGKFMVFTMSALIVGVVFVLPVYLDLAYIAADSARVNPDPSFFTKVLPKFNTLMEVLHFFVLGTIPELFGNPIKSTFPFSYDGLSVTPFVVFVSVIALLSVFRKTWGWWLVIVILCLFAFVHPLYVFGIKYLGFNLSRSTPLGSIMLPLTIILAYGIDALVKRSIPRVSCTVLIATISVLVVLLVGLGFGWSQKVIIHWDIVIVTLILIALFFAQYEKTRPVLLIIALVVVIATTSYPLMLHQNLSSIAISSPLVEKVKANLPVGSRFAIASPGLPVLPPNLNASIGLSSVHSYNSLSSKKYHFLINELGGNMQTYGRYNSSISPDYNSTIFWMSNIGLILSPKRLAHENLEYLGKESGVYFHKVLSRMGDSFQVIHSMENMVEIDNNLQISNIRQIPGYTQNKQLKQGDLLEFKVTSGSSSILVLSQKFHRDWQAEILDSSEWKPAKTVIINSVFQGVLLPQNTQLVRLEFKPYVHYAYFAHIFWLLLLGLVVFKAWQKKRMESV